MIEATRKKEPKDRQFVAALAKGLELLRCFTPSTPELGASEIARMTGMPQPTVWRLCHTLLKLGFLVGIPGRQTMRPGIPLLGLGYSVLAGQPISELALPDMQAIATRHEGAVSLGARDGLSMIYLQRCQGSQIILADMRVGSRVPLGTSATGWAFIAGLSDRDRAAVFSELRSGLGKQWRDVEPRLAAALRGYEKTGYVVNKGLLHRRINSVGVPVQSPDGSTRLALSAGGIDELFQSEKLAKIGAELSELASRIRPLLVSNSRA